MGTGAIIGIVVVLLLLVGGGFMFYNKSKKDEEAAEAQKEADAAAQAEYNAAVAAQAAAAQQAAQLEYDQQVQSASSGSGDCGELTMDSDPSCFPINAELGGKCGPGNNFQRCKGKEMCSSVGTCGTYPEYKHMPHHKFGGPDSEFFSSEIDTGLCGPMFDMQNCYGDEVCGPDGDCGPWDTHAYEMYAKHAGPDSNFMKANPPEPQYINMATGEQYVDEDGNPISLDEKLAAEAAAQAEAEAAAQAAAEAAAKAAADEAARVAAETARQAAISNMKDDWSSTTYWGGGGGGAFPNQKCNSDSFDWITRFNTRSGSYLDKVQGFCKSGKALGAYGGNGGGAADINPGGAPIVSVDLRSGAYIDKLGNRGGNGGGPRNITCPSGTAISGYYGRSGAYVDRLGFYCKPVSPEYQGQRKCQKILSNGHQITDCGTYSGYPQPQDNIIMQDTDLWGGDIGSVASTSPTDCLTKCKDDAACSAFTYNATDKLCLKKNRNSVELKDSPGNSAAYVSRRRRLRKRRRRR